jgi:hypothetical protein
VLAAELAPEGLEELLVELLDELHAARAAAMPVITTAYDSDRLPGSLITHASKCLSSQPSRER